jgi:hypothetical protein
MRIGIEGRVFRVHNKQTFEQVCEKNGIQIERDLWLPNGKGAASSDKLRHHFPPGLDEIQYVDEEMPGDTRSRRKKLGLVKLKIAEFSIVVPNKQSFGQAFERKSVEIQAEFILLPNSKRVEIGEGRSDVNKYIYLVWPQRGIWLHRTTARRDAR